MANYLDELNEGQRAAVLYNDGPSLVIAGAGSGKTRVLTYKIAYLLDQGYKPWSILALTFTNKAAREMKERIARQVGENLARYLWMGTFHSIFSRILRAEADAIGFHPISLSMMRQTRKVWSSPLFVRWGWMTRLTSREWYRAVSVRLKPFDLAGCLCCQRGIVSGRC